MDVTHPGAGIYFLVADDDDKMEVKKVVVREMKRLRKINF